MYLQELYEQVEAFAARQCQGCHFLLPNKLLHSCIHWTFLEKYTSYLNHGGDVSEDRVVQLAMSVQKDLQLGCDLSVDKCLELVKLFKQVNLVQLFLPADERIYSLIKNFKVKQVMEDVGQDYHNSKQSSCKIHNDIHLVTPEDLVRQTTSYQGDTESQVTSDKCSRANISSRWLGLFLTW